MNCRFSASSPSPSTLQKHRGSACRYKDSQSIQLYTQGKTTEPSKRGGFLFNDRLRGIAMAVPLHRPDFVLPKKRATLCLRVKLARFAMRGTARQARLNRSPSRRARPPPSPIWFESEKNQTGERTMPYGEPTCVIPQFYGKSGREK